jgi:FAD-dependent urate hydroxylase
MSERYDVAVVGAGPYGLSVAAHLRHYGIDTTVLGHPMASWKTMPVGTYLKSLWGISSNLSEPTGQFTLDCFTRLQGKRFAGPIPLSHFVEYGLWFHREAVGEVTTQLVDELDWDGDLFRLRLDDGRTQVARRVVLAPGIGRFARLPDFAADLPAEVASHTAALTDPRRFCGQRVLVVGAGQSALEVAALLKESGAVPELVVRAAMVLWIRNSPWSRPPWLSLVYGPSVVGPPVLSRLVDFPRLLRYMPRAIRARLDARAVRPAGAVWLRSRVEGEVPTTTGVSVMGIDSAPAGLQVRLSDGSTRQVDHVLFGTGYVPRLDRLRFISPRLAAAVRSEDGLPVLDSGFESSVPGLHFTGAPASGTFGPIFKFVAGARVAAPAVAWRVRAAAGAGAPLPRPTVVQPLE